MRVALVVDVRNWALDGIAHALRRYVGETDLHLDLYYQSDYNGATAVDQLRGALRRYDLLYPLGEYIAAWLRPIMRGEKPYITTIHAFPQEPARSDAHMEYRAAIWEGVVGADRVSVISTPLWQRWERMVNDLRRVTVGADPEIFFPCERGVPTRALRVGWCGNPRKAVKQFDRIQQAVESLEFVEFAPLCVPNVAEARPQAEVGEYMRSLDVYVCLSDNEGLPTPGVEAAVSGIPIVSTDVGVMREVVVDGLTGFIIPQSVDALRDRLRWLWNHRDYLPRMRAAMATRAAHWRWPLVVGEWVRFIQDRT